MLSATMVISLRGDYDTIRQISLSAMLSEINGVDFLEFNHTNKKMAVSFNLDGVSLVKLNSILEQEKKPRSLILTNRRKGELDYVTHRRR
jgi:hypothetical protein